MTTASETAFERHSHAIKSMAIATFVTPTPGHLSVLRTLVGSVHFWSPDTSIVIYASPGLSLSAKETIESFANVVLVEASSPALVVGVDRMIGHALQLFESVLFVDAQLYVSHRLDDVRAQLHRDGFLLGTLQPPRPNVGKDMCEPDVFGIRKGSPFLSLHKQGIWSTPPYALSLRTDEAFIEGLLYAAVRELRVSGDPAIVVGDWIRKLGSAYITTRKALLEAAANPRVWESVQLAGDDADLNKALGSFFAAASAAKSAGAAAGAATDEAKAKDGEGAESGLAKVAAELSLSVDGEVHYMFIDGVEVDAATELSNRKTLEQPDLVRRLVRGGRRIIAIAVGPRRGGDKRPQQQSKIALWLQLVLAHLIDGRKEEKQNVVFRTGHAPERGVRVKVAPLPTGVGWARNTAFDDSPWVDVPFSQEGCGNYADGTVRDMDNAVRPVWVGGCVRNVHESYAIRIHVDVDGARDTLMRTLQVNERKLRAAARAMGHIEHEKNLCPALSSQLLFPIHMQSDEVHAYERVYLNDASSGTTSTVQFDVQTGSFSTVPHKSRTLASSFSIMPVSGEQGTRLMYGKPVRLSTHKRSFLVSSAEHHVVGAKEVGELEALTFVMQGDSPTGSFLTNQARVRFRIANSLGVGTDLFLVVGSDGKLTTKKDDATVFVIESTLDYRQHIRKRNDIAWSISQSTAHAQHEDHPFLNMQAHKHHHDAAADGKKGEKKPYTDIALLIATKSPRGRDVPQLPLVSPFIETFKGTIETKEAQKKRGGEQFRYVFYVGYDVGDMLDNPAKTAMLQQLMDRELGAYPFLLKTSRHVGATGAPCWVWNNLAEEAYADGAEYLYQVNDDTKFITSGWTQEFVAALRNSKAHPNVGVTGPREVGYQGDGRIIPQAFVHRIHMEIFPVFYPREFRNWWSDDWITEVYRGVGYDYSIATQQIRNTQAAGTRYTVFAASHFLKAEVAKGQELIRKFLAEHKK